MKIRDLEAKLVEEHGAIVRNQYHMQIAFRTGYHDIWHGKDGLKWKLFGMKKTDSGNPERLLAALLAYQSEDTDLARMQRLVTFLKRISGRTGVFVDAGWRAGKAKAAIVHAFGDGDCDILVRCFSADNAEQAELKIIELAHIRFNTTIYSDCQSAVEKYGSPAVWIPRESNKEADSLGNMRS